MYSAELAVRMLTYKICHHVPWPTRHDDTSGRERAVSDHARERRTSSSSVVRYESAWRADACGRYLQFVRSLARQKAHLACLYMIDETPYVAAVVHIDWNLHSYHYVHSARPISLAATRGAVENSHFRIRETAKRARLWST